MQFTARQLDNIFQSACAGTIAVVGDVMLDKYIWGSVSRISPEAPVPVVDVEAETTHPGGASNVALNIEALGATPLLVGVVGEDANAEELRAIFRKAGISCDALVVDRDRPTTVKTRIIAGHQHVVRIDYEKRTEISADITARILAELHERLESIKIIVLQDYDKGVMTPELIGEVIALANDHDLPVLVDPKFKNFFAYHYIAPKSFSAFRNSCKARRACSYEI